MDFETSREAQNSTNAVGHVNLVEVNFSIFRTRLGRPTRSCNSTTSLCNFSDKIFNPSKLKLPTSTTKLLIRLFL